MRSAGCSAAAMRMRCASRFCCRKAANSPSCCFRPRLPPSIFSTETASLLIAIVTLSMAMTPLFVPATRFFIVPEAEEQLEEDFDGAEADVLMIGFSRFGQIAAQMLLTGGSSVTIIDHSAERVRSAAKFGFRLYFGDGTRKDVLEASGIRRAKLVAVCTNKRAITDRIVDLIKSDFPDTKLFVRSYDRTHTLELRAKGVDYELRETFESGLRFGQKTLEALGMDEDTASEILEDVRRRDEERLALQAVEGLQAGRGPGTPSRSRPSRSSSRSREAKRHRQGGPGGEGRRARRQLTPCR